MIRAQIPKAPASAAIAVAVALAAPACAGPGPFEGLGCDCPKTVKKGDRPAADQIILGIHSGLTGLQEVPDH